MKKIKDKRAFTLLEIILSLTIVSIALVVIIQSFSLSLRAKNHLRNISCASLLADKLITDIQLYSLETQGKEGEFKSPFEKFFWQVKIKRTFGQLKDVQVLIFWDKKNLNKKIEIFTQIKEES